MPGDNALVSRLLLRPLACILFIIILVQGSSLVDADDSYGTQVPASASPVSNPSQYPPSSNPAVTAQHSASQVPDGKRECGCTLALPIVPRSPIRPSVKACNLAQNAVSTMTLPVIENTLADPTFSPLPHLSPSLDIDCKVQENGLCPKGCHPGGLYGCLPVNEQFPKTCEAYYNQPSCEKAPTVNNAKCGWDPNYNRCTFIRHAPVALTPAQLHSKIEAQRRARATAAARSSQNSPSSSWEQRTRTAAEDDPRIHAQELASTDPNAVFNSNSHSSSPSSSSSSSPSSGNGSGRKGDALTAEVGSGGSRNGPVATSQNGGGGGGGGGGGNGSGDNFQLNNGNDPTGAFGNPTGNTGNNGPKDADWTTTDKEASNAKTAAIIGSCVGALALAGFALLAIHQYKVRSAQRSMQLGAAEANSSSLLSNIRRALNPSRP
ncbi:MAG: hypothetical protein DHS80DRAFT_21021 [Piptocephalis tieghemiana]|nr:MAG: hypothetical protein DHS80DRAFT_21021 [Piptocephalis tieghemiana]